MGQDLLSGFKALALTFKLASRISSICLGSEELILHGAPRGATWTSPAVGGQWASYLDDMSHQQPFQVNTSFTYLGAGNAGWGET